MQVSNLADPPPPPPYAVNFCTQEVCPSWKPYLNPAMMEPEPVPCTNNQCGKSECCLFNGERLCFHLVLRPTQYSARSLYVFLLSVAVGYNVPMLSIHNQLRVLTFKVS